MVTSKRRNLPQLKRQHWWMIVFGFSFLLSFTSFSRVLSFIIPASCKKVFFFIPFSKRNCSTIANKKIYKLMPVNEDTLKIPLKKYLFVFAFKKNRRSHENEIFYGVLHTVLSNSMKKMMVFIILFSVLKKLKLWCQIFHEKKKKQPIRQMRFIFLSLSVGPLDSWQTIW